MNKQVLSIEQCKELKLLGFDMSNASMFWVKERTKDNWYLEPQDGTIKGGVDIIPTFTLQDILEMLPGYIEIKIEDKSKPNGFYHRDYYLYSNLKNSLYYFRQGMFSDDVDTLINIEKDNLLQAAFEMLKWYKQTLYDS